MFGIVDYKLQMLLPLLPLLLLLFQFSIIQYQSQTRQSNVVMLYSVYNNDS